MDGARGVDMSALKGSVEGWEVLDRSLTEPEVLELYEHHGVEVAVRPELRGKHREHCLCFSCPAFNPDVRENSCPIANLLYAVCVAFNLATPVFECARRAELLQAMDREG